MRKTSSFALLIVLMSILSMIFISFLSKQTALVSIEHYVKFGNILLILFSTATIALFIKELFLSNVISVKPAPKALLILSLSLLLVLSIFQKQVGIIATSIFILISISYAIINRKIYTPNRVYIFIVIYALLQLFGTIGTVKGFRFPDMSFSFYLIPISFYCFRIEKTVLLQIMRFFFRAMLIYMAITLIFWYFNMQFLNIGFLEWMKQKVLTNGFNAYYWTNSWTNYMHPSYISLVLFPALFSGLYLYYKKLETSKISKFELLVFIFFSIASQIAMQSRIGIVCIAFILTISFFYYLKLRTKFFKWGIFTTVILIGISFVILGNKVDGFITDPVRKMDSTLAINYIKSHPWWGAGYHQEALALSSQQEISKDKITIVPNVKTYTHNEFLGDTVQFGVLGLIVLLILLFGLLRYSVISKSFLLQQFFCLYFIFMLIEEPLYVQEGITRFMVFLAFFIHLSECDHPIKSIELWKRLPKSEPAK